MISRKDAKETKWRKDKLRLCGYFAALRETNAKSPLNLFRKFFVLIAYRNITPQIFSLFAQSIKNNSYCHFFVLWYY